VSRGAGGGAGAARHREWLDRETERFLQRQQATEELEREVRKREEVVMAKEALLRDQAALDLKRRRNVEEARQSIHGLQARIDTIAAAEAGAGAGAGAGQRVLLERQKAQAMEEKAALEARLAAHDKMLSAEEEAQLQELEDRLEALDMEMEYKADSIAQLRSLVQEKGGGEEHGAGEGLRGLDALLAAADGREDAGGEGGGEEGKYSWNIPEGEARALLHECLRRVLLLEEVARKRDNERCLPCSNRSE